MTWSNLFFTTFLHHFAKKKLSSLRDSALFIFFLTNFCAPCTMCLSKSNLYFTTISDKILRMGRQNWWCWPGDASPLLSALLLYSMLLWMVKGLGWSRVRKRRRRLRRKQGWPHVCKVTKQTPQLMKPNLLQTMPNK